MQVYKSEAHPIPGGITPTLTNPNAGVHNSNNWPQEVIAEATDLQIDCSGGGDDAGGGQWAIDVSSPGVGVYHRHCIIDKHDIYKIDKIVQDIRITCIAAPRINETVTFMLVTR